MFPTQPETGDNSWFGQPLLFNSNVKATRPVGNKLETRIITNEYLALPPELNLNLNEIYRGGILLSEAELEALVNTKLDLNYTIDPNTHPKLKFMTKSILGSGEKSNGQLKTFPNTIPLMNPKPPKYSSSTLENLVNKTIKGSKNFRKILSRGKDFITKKLINNWKKNLG